MKVGLTLPSFTEDPETPLRVAAAAEAAGVDGIFVYDHLFRIGRNGEMRPALECTALLGAVAAETTPHHARHAGGARDAAARRRRSPPRSTPSCASPGPRLVAGLGAGDEDARSEMETFGLPMGTEHDRVKRLRASLREIADRPYPAWVGGRARHVGLGRGRERQGLEPLGTRSRRVRARGGRGRVARAAAQPRPGVVHHELGRARGARRGRRRRTREGRAARAPGPAPSSVARAPSRRRWPAIATPAPSGSSSGRSTPRIPTTPPASARSSAPACGDLSAVRPTLARSATAGVTGAQASLRRRRRNPAPAARPDPIIDVEARWGGEAGRALYMPKCVRWSAATAGAGPRTSTCAARCLPNRYRSNSPGGPLSRAVGSPGRRFATTRLPTRA